MAKVSIDVKAAGQLSVHPGNRRDYQVKPLLRFQRYVVTPAAESSRPTGSFADKATVQSVVRENIARKSRLHTDKSRLYGARMSVSCA